MSLLNCENCEYKHICITSSNPVCIGYKPMKYSGKFTGKILKKEKNMKKKKYSGKFSFKKKDLNKMRKFSTGATRDTNEGKLDYEGFLSPLVIKRYGEYMTKHRKQSEGTLRDSDNWQKGIPINVYIKSAWRHFIDLWSEHRGITTKGGIEEALCALLFNVMGYLHEHLKGTKKK